MWGNSSVTESWEPPSAIAVTPGWHWCRAATLDSTSSSILQRYRSISPEIPIFDYGIMVALPANRTKVTNSFLPFPGPEGLPVLPTACRAVEKLPPLKLILSPSKILFIAPITIKIWLTPWLCSVGKGDGGATLLWRCRRCFSCSCVTTNYSL